MGKNPEAEKKEILKFSSRKPYRSGIVQLFKNPSRYSSLSGYWNFLCGTKLQIFCSMNKFTNYMRFFVTGFVFSGTLSVSNES